MFSGESEPGRKSKDDLVEGFSRETTLDSSANISNVVFNRKLSFPDDDISCPVWAGSDEKKEKWWEQITGSKAAKDIFGRARRKVKTIVDFRGKIGLRRG